MYPSGLETGTYHHGRRLLEVEMDPIAIYLMMTVCAAAFLPPVFCKIRQEYCTVVQITPEDEETYGY